MSTLLATWDRAWRTFRTAWRELLAADVVYKVLAVVFLAPLVGAALRLFLSLSGDAVRADQDILYFVLSPIGILTIVVVGAGFVGVTALEIACLMTIALGAGAGVRIAVADALRFGLSRARLVLRTARRIVMRVLLLASPFVALASVLAWWQLTDHDINFYLTNRPPEFLVTAAGIAGILLAMLAVLIPRLASWSLVLPIVVFENASSRRSFTLSAERVGDERTRVVAILVSWGVASVLASTVTLGVVRVLALGAVDGLAGRPVLLLTTMAVLLFAWFAASLAVNVLTACFFALLIVDIHVRHAGRGWDPTLVPAVPAGQRRAWAASNALLLVGIAATVPAVAAARSIVGHARTQQPVTITAHRGAADAAPENTLASVRAALAARADQVEIDVQETADGRVVVLHDSDFMKIAGDPRKVWSTTFGDLADLDIGSWYDPSFSDERVPLLREVLETVRGRATLTIELKYYGHDQDLERRVVDIVEEAGMADDVAIISLEYDALSKMRALRPDWPIGLLTARAVGDLTDLDADFLAVNTALATRRFIRRAHAAGKKVFVWTVNDPATMALMVARGADGLITDRPGLARTVVNRRAALGIIERLLVDFSLALGRRPSQDDVTRETSGVGSGVPEG